MTRARALSIVAVLGLAPAATASTIDVFLDEAHQGKGNKGAEFRPVDAFGETVSLLITARSSIDHESPLVSDAAGFAGTVYIDEDGAGVQADDGGGSKGISGGGGDKDEEIIFTFDDPTDAGTVQVGLFDFRAGDGLGDDDDVILFVNLVGASETLVLDEGSYMSAYSQIGDDSGLVDFGLLGLGAGALIESFGVRETNGHNYVNFVGYGAASVVPLPAPVALGLAGLAAVAARRGGRRLVRRAR